MNKLNGENSQDVIPSVDKEQLRYGVEMMRAAMGRARWLSITYAHGQSVQAYGQIDRDLCDLLELMDKHNWDLKSFFTEAANPNIQAEGEASDDQRISLASEWEEAVQKAYETLLPRKSFKKHLNPQRAVK